MRRKQNKEKKIDIYRILMLPLMTMFLLNIGLIATTWAWYTASISTGTNTLRAGSQVKITVTDGNGTEINSINGKYVLPSGTNTIQLTGGSATTGYVVLLDIEESNTTGTANSILDIFFTPVYAESKKYAIEVGNGEDKTITITLSSVKTLSITNIWKEGGTSLTQGYDPLLEDNSINLIRSYTINLTNEEGTPLKQSEVKGSISPYSENTGSDEAAVITVDDAEETEIEIPVIDGYELISVNGEAPKASYLLVEGQENVFNAKYKKITESTEQNPEVTSDNNEAEISENKEVTDENLKNQESNNVTVGDESANEEVTEQTDPVVESTESIGGTEETAPASDPVQIQESSVEQQTGNTESEQPATEPQQESSSEVDTVGQDPVVQSEDTTVEENTEVLEDDTNEVGQ